MTGYYVRVKRAAGHWESADITSLSDAELEELAVAEPVLGWDWARALATWIEGHVDIRDPGLRELIQSAMSLGPDGQGDGWATAKALARLIRDRVLPLPPIPIPEEPPDAPR